MRWIMSLLALALVVVLVLIGWTEQPASRGGETSATGTEWVIRNGMRAPVFGVQDVRGDSLRLQDLAGRYVLLDFWFTTCPPCLDELPRIRALQQKYAEQLVVVGVSIDRDRDRFDRFLEREKIDWPQVLDILDNAGAVQALYQAPYYPSYWLVNPDGEIALYGRHVLDELETAGLRYEYDG